MAGIRGWLLWNRTAPRNRSAYSMGSFYERLETLKLEAPRGLIPSMSEAELTQTVDWLVAHKDVESSGKKMRETTEEDGTTWLITEEGLPGATRGQPGGIALRFISPKGTRYLVLCWPSGTEWRTIT
jgi:hypothetical protein